MWVWILVGAVALWAGVVWVQRHRRTPDGDLREFVTRFSVEIERCGPEYRVRGLVPDSLTMIVSVHGQEVPVPFENIFRHYVLYPGQLMALARQLLAEIEEVGLEQPEDRIFADAAMQIMPQVCRSSWVQENAPPFGDSALVTRALGPDLTLCYVIDDPWSVVFVCKAHLEAWGRTEQDLFHLANQNLRRLSGGELPLPAEDGEPVRVHRGDGYDAVRVLLLDPRAADDLVIAMPQRDELYLGREAELDRMQSLLLREDSEASEYPVSTELYRLRDQQLVPLSGPSPE